MINIEEALEYYNKKASKKVAQRFLFEYKKIVKILKSNPFFQIKFDEYRFVPFYKFPYIVFFIVNEPKKEVYLNAVFHSSQNTGKYPS